LEVPSAGAEIKYAETRGHLEYTFTWSDGSITLDELSFKITYDENAKRVLVPSWIRHASHEAVEGDLVTSAVSRAGSEVDTTVVLLNDKVFKVFRSETTIDLFGDEEVTTSQYTLGAPAESRIRCYALNGQGSRLYAVTESNHIILWDLSKGKKDAVLTTALIPARYGPVTAMAVVYGDESVALGHANGKITTWSYIFESQQSNTKNLRVLHELRSHSSAVVSLCPSMRDKSIVSLSQDGVLHVDHMTSESGLLSLADVDRHYYLSPRNNGITYLSGAGKVTVNDLNMKHPEASVRTLFGKIWYESYPGPQFVWQSSSASDDFEPKMSLMPLIFGSLKGTFYAMFIAVPLAILGALYTSQCTHPRVRAVVKPVVEIMAAVPSVIIGFLAALWLAPIVERNLSSFFLSFVTIPLVVLIAILVWQFLRKNYALRKLEGGYEFIALMPILIFGGFLAGWLGPILEDAFFGGSVKQALYDGFNVHYDPRNCFIIAYALGFAVIPIIFTISEDAFSNVPGGLTAASLACGASRWQTVWRVVLPSASPGLFAAVVIGFGRAVGETMIVLMATGNTPIMKVSPFNGMRTLSANIAVEIPEAPHGGTLYRVLFLSAVILFLLTSVLNTIAEVVRQRLRKKYGQFQ
jgi:phosphate transport system permease protein